MVIKMKVLLGTKNQGKIKEIIEICENIMPELEVITLNDMFDVEEPVEDKDTFLGNATLKAEYYYNIYKIPVICDDSGLVIEALNGEPGVLSARYAGEHDFEANIDKVLDKMQGIENRKAYFQTTAVYYDGKKIIAADGFCHGEILNKRHGTNGFGYDPIFFVESIGMTFGEAEDEIKNKLSHRYNAIKKLLTKLKNA